MRGPVGRAGVGEVQDRPATTAHTAERAPSDGTQQPPHPAADEVERGLAPPAGRVVGDELA